PALRPSDGANLAAALTALGPRVRSATVAPHRNPVRRSALTGGERRLLSVVRLATSDRDTLAADELQRAIRPYGGHMEQLADGSTIVVIEPDQQTDYMVATDQAAQAARCALAIRALIADRPMAIAMGRVESTGQRPGGEVIDRASRLLADSRQAAAVSMPIALDEISAGLLDARFDVVEVGSGLMLRGERALIHGARTLLGRPTACVGRDWELNALMSILDECIDEREARAVIVTAAAGMGKSRLAAELVTRIQQRGEPVAVWVARGDSLRAGSTLGLLAQALRGVLGLPGGESLAVRHDKIRTWVAEHAVESERKRVAEFLGELIGAPFPADGAAGASLRAARHDAQLMSEQMRRAWMDFLDAEAAAHPVLLVLEDLHWGDFGTVRFIDTALRDRRERPWMVLALARPEVFQMFPKLWAERHNVQEIRLKELGRKAGERLVCQVLGDRVGPDTIKRLVRQAEGNAFYLEELIRAAAEGKDGALPDTVLAMVETRLGRLALEARRVLRAASVFGEVCWEGGVGALLGSAMAAATVSEWLETLVEQEALAVRPNSRFPGEREFVFRHALLREGAYATLTEDDRRLGHRLAGEWLAQNGEADPMVLAGHFDRGGEGARAASYYLRAAEQASLIADLDAMVTRAGLGLACDPPHELRNALLGMRCEASSYGLQMLDATMADAEELMRSAPRGSIPWAQAVNAYLSGMMMVGRIDDLLAAIALLREVDPDPEAMERMALAFLSGLSMLDNLGRVPEATTLESRFLAVVRALGSDKPLAQFWWNIAVGMRASYAHEDPWTALEHSDAIQAIHDAIGGEQIFLNMQLFRGLNLWHLGALTAAERTLNGIVVADEALGVASSLRRLGLSWIRADLGALEEARSLADELSDYGRSQHNSFEEGRGRWVLAEVLRRIGDLDRADREIHAALGMSVPLEQPGVLATLSALRLAQGRAGEALAAAEDAVSRCTAMGGCGMFRGVFARLAHAEALHATGAHDAARRAIAGARARLFAIVDKIPDPAYKASFLEHVPENARTLALAAAWLGDPAPPPAGD
ncbi:MAG TPA: AAA family ATPase, partial [Kofleriaceae bacterium]